MVTMCGWRILPASEASFWNCWRYTAPNSGSRNTSGSMVFSATSRPVKVSLARYTVPVAPLPSAFCTSYLPICSPKSKEAAAGAFSGIDVRGFHGGVELDRVAPLLARAIAGSLATAERHVVVHACGRQIHHHHAGRGIALEVLRILQRSSRDPGRKPEWR